MIVGIESFHLMICQQISAVVSLYYDDDDNRHGFYVKASGEETQAAQHTVLEDIPLEEWLHLVGHL